MEQVINWLMDYGVWWLLAAFFVGPFAAAFVALGDEPEV